MARKIHGVPQKDPNATPIGAVLYVLAGLVLLLGFAVASYLSWGECTRVHPVWYCLVH